MRWEWGNKLAVVFGHTHTHRYMYTGMYFQDWLWCRCYHKFISVYVVVVFLWEKLQLQSHCLRLYFIVVWQKKNIEKWRLLWQKTSAEYHRGLRRGTIWGIGRRISPLETKLAVFLLQVWKCPLYLELCPCQNGLFTLYCKWYWHNEVKFVSNLLNQIHDFIYRKS